MIFPRLRAGPCADSNHGGPARRHQEHVMIAVSAAVARLRRQPRERGIGIQAGAVCAATTVQPGHTYALPPVQVADRGSGGETSPCGSERRPPEPHPLHGLRVPPSWVTFTYPRKWLDCPPSRQSRQPAETALVPARLAIPSSAAPGATWPGWLAGCPGQLRPARRAASAATGDTGLEFTVTGPGSPPRHVVCVTPGAKQASAAKGAHLTGACGHASPPGPRREARPDPREGPQVRPGRHRPGRVVGV